MRIEILDVDRSSEPPRVRFASALGEAWAHWAGDPPPAGQTFHVELSVQDPLTWGESILPAAETAHRLEPDGSGIAIHATLESCEDDGSTVLRLGNSVLMVDAYGDPPPPGTAVRAYVPALTLYDTGI
jgi:hypothetical protein